MSLFNKGRINKSNQVQNMNKNKIIIKLAKNNQTYVVVKGKNNKTLATTETYKSKQGSNNVVKALKKVIKNAVVVDNTKKSKKK
ncbi:MAG TPA: DUF1508 domain-containing protein [Candidatus Paceibacterota bacterium]|nr:DUF1508 domain-containing protein [Candidatus Paceibacterota bacterium]